MYTIFEKAKLITIKLCNDYSGQAISNVGLYFSEHTVDYDRAAHMNERNIPSQYSLERRFI
ncbi:hypothetical protein H5410_051328 [Solanum commersonii]|uniref:Uncharacterized protein n=1 Tax=Solanum commersonii TaxID=4109 RepID=A0A9J5WZP4_SOLCO|nr:hypothetical protein H5410_051328 [Solanum commersonii]